MNGLFAALVCLGLAVAGLEAGKPGVIADATRAAGAVAYVAKVQLIERLTVAEQDAQVWLALGIRG